MNCVPLFLFASLFLATASYADNPFDDVFEIMSRQRGPDSMGCAGCHIGADSVPGVPYFGATQDEVEEYLRTDDYGYHVAGRLNSPIARRLRHDGDPAPMPRSGTQWTQDELGKLYAWLDRISYSSIDGLVDTFIGDTINPDVWTVTYDFGGGIAYESEGLSLSAYPNSGDSGAFVTSNNSFSLFDSSAYVKMIDVVNNGNINNQFVLIKDWNNSLNWWFEDGNLLAVQVVAGTQTTVAVLPYVPSQYAWLRIREEDGNVYWETSKDGVNWVVQATRPNSFPLGSLNVLLLVKEWGEGIAVPGTARYSNLNIGAVP
jgi:hypothetical protein